PVGLLVGIGSTIEAVPLGAIAAAPPPRLRRVWINSALAGLGALALPLAVSIAWVPIRATAPNIDVALVLVVVTLGLGTTGRRLAVVAGALSATLSFTYFDTRPFDRFVIARSPDVETAALLGLVGLIVGECAVRVVRQRVAARAQREVMLRIRLTAGLVASGEEAVEVVASTQAQLAELLSLAACRFEAVPPGPDIAQVRRDGGVARPLGSGGTSNELALPVWAQGQVVGHFMLLSARTPSLGALQVAVTLADQVGAVLAAYAPRDSTAAPAATAGPELVGPELVGPEPAGPALRLVGPSPARRPPRPRGAPPGRSGG
ncbi:MAG: Osmosensitive channel histidine kinaselike protein, partial [Acidimicrobiaceae bacterium]|nr:Osmosensitive channel histidine kinaselike protein [Acidimicrobiaceae bacterium]